MYNISGFVIIDDKGKMPWYVVHVDEEDALMHLDFNSKQLMDNDIDPEKCQVVPVEASFDYTRQLTPEQIARCEEEEDKIRIG